MPAVSLSLADALLDALPQTQCTRCSYADCRGYAEAIAGGDADVNRCPPGGHEGVRRLARIAGRRVSELDAACGHEGPRSVAVIDEAACIGCALCLKACPVDAIVGAAKRMHTVIDALCTGCELCLPVCPVDCIGLEAASGSEAGWAAWSPAQAAAARQRYAARTGRVEAAARAADAAQDASAPAAETIAAAVARARGTRAAT